MKETFESLNPATEEVVARFPGHDEGQIEARLLQAAEAQRLWQMEPFKRRSELLCGAARQLRDRKSKWAGIVTLEMGKPIGESEAEVEKCAWVCEYYAEHAEEFLSRRDYPSSAKESYLQQLPLGVLLAIMPWNYPLWQVFRFAAPALMAGNTALLKHASNVPQCALAMEEIFRNAGAPDGVFASLLISGSQASQLIKDNRIAAVTLTGSEAAGSKVASTAGASLKKTVLELGGSDPFIVLEDADLEQAVQVGVKARFQNTGQSCIAAKRFLVVEPVYDEFEQRYVEAVRQLKLADPRESSTDLGPMARDDLRDELHSQVERSLAQGARLLTGGKRRPGKGFYYEPTVLAGVSSEMAAGREEVFGPAAALMKVAGEDEAIQVANESDYGLGSSLWTSDLERARRLAPRIEAGQVFVNQMVASDPRLPFGGVKRSGYGRELSDLGIREFVNLQTVSIAN